MRTADGIRVIACNNLALEASRETGVVTCRREACDQHAAANRHLLNKLIGQLHHCLQHRQYFDEAKAFPVAAGVAA